MYIPKRNLTKDELTAVIAKRVFRQERKTLEGQAAFMELRRIQEEADTMFTDAMFAEDFSRIVIQGPKEFFPKVFLRVCGFYSAHFDGDITQDELGDAILHLLNLSEDFADALSAFSKINTEGRMPYMELNIATGQVIIE